MIPIRDLNPAGSQPLVTWWIIGANVLVFVAVGGLSGDAELTEAARRFGAFAFHFSGMEPRDVVGHDLFGRLQVIQPIPREPWFFTRAFTHMWIHGGWLHLIGNMWFLHVFGDNVEDRMGRARFALFYVASGIVALAAQVLADPASGLPMVGASGAVAGALGAYLRLFPRARVLAMVPIGFFPLMVVWPALVFLGIWLVLQILNSLIGLTAETGVAWFAHVGGFAFGWIAAGASRAPGPGRTRVEVDRADSRRRD